MAVMSLLSTCVATLGAAQAVLGLATPQSADEGVLSRRAEGSFVNMGYWSYTGPQKRLSEISANDLTHVLYAFTKVDPNGTVRLRRPIEDVGSTDQIEDAGGKWAELFAFKKKNPHIKTLLSVGGWPDVGEEKDFPNAAANAENRQRFVETAVQLMLDGGFDGLDVDWEWPTPHQMGNHAELMVAVRKRLDELESSHNNYHFLLTACIFARPGMHDTLEFKKLIPALDYWHLMAYDYSGGWSYRAQHLGSLFASKTKPQTTLMGTDDSINNLVGEHGVPLSKIVLGIPAYARTFKNVSQLGDEKNRTSDNDAIALRSMNLADFEYECDDEVVACSGFHKKTKMLAVFDTAATADRKVKYAMDRKLAGTFFWDLNQDLDGEKAFYVNAARRLGNLDRSPALLEFPESRYGNIRGNSTFSSSIRPSVPTASSSVVVDQKSTKSPQWNNMTTTAGPEKKPSSSASRTSDKNNNKAPATGAVGVMPPTEAQGIVCAAGERCDHLYKEMAPAINADGLVIKTVSAVIVVVGKCRDEACVAADGKNATTTTTLTESAFATLCPMDATLAPATTVTLSADDASKPIPVTKAGRIANVCVTEMGCRATEVPVPDRTGRSRASGSDSSGASSSGSGSSGASSSGSGSSGASSSGSGSSGASSSGSGSSGASSSGSGSKSGSSAPSGSTSDNLNAPAFDAADRSGVRVSASASASAKAKHCKTEGSSRAKSGVSEEKLKPAPAVVDGSSASPARAAALSAEDMPKFKSESYQSGSAPAGSRVSEEASFGPVSEQAGSKSFASQSRVMLSSTLANASSPLPSASLLSNGQATPMVSGAAAQQSACVWALLPAMAMLVL